MFGLATHRDTEDIKGLIMDMHYQLTQEEPQRWALLLEKYFAIRKDTEGLMLAQAMSKRLAARKKYKPRQPKPSKELVTSEQE